MKNSNVALAWKNGKYAATANFHTDGTDIYSYALRIGTTTEKGKKIVYNYTKNGKFYSMTTSKHVSYANRYADEMREPR